MLRIERLPLVGFMVTVLVAGPAAPATAADAGAPSLRVEWGPPAESGADGVLRGRVVNDSMVRVGDVRLRVETVDAEGRVIGRSFGWVIGDVPAGGRAYFMVRDHSRGTTGALTLFTTSALRGHRPREDDTMSDKARLLADADEAFLDLRQAVDGLDDGRLTRVWLGSWSIREILVHITGWHQEMIPALGRVARGDAPYPAGTYDDFDTWNARFVENKRGVKVADVLAQLETSHRDFVRAADAVPDAQLGAARDLIEGTGPGHYREHAAQIRAWRQQESA